MHVPTSDKRNNKEKKEGKIAIIQVVSSYFTIDLFYMQFDSI